MNSSEKPSKFENTTGNVNWNRNKDVQYGTNRRVALITGSSSGIGANIAVDLSKAGYIVVVTGRDQSSLNKVVQKCHETSNKDQAFSHVADLMSNDDIENLINFVSLKFNRLDILINNVCVRGEPTNILDADESLRFSQIMHLNVTVPMNLFQRCLRNKLFPCKNADASSRGIVINISSIAGQVVVPLHFYSISKACLTELSRQLAIMSDKTNVLSITISPGPVLTNERPHHQMMSKHTLLNRVGSTQEISNLVLHAIKHAPLFNGEELTIDGGYMAKQKQPSPTDV